MSSDLSACIWSAWRSSARCGVLKLCMHTSSPMDSASLLVNGAPHVPVLYFCRWFSHFPSQTTLVVGAGKMCPSRVRVRCNGWKKGDVLKIFVRPRGGGRVSCCDLAVGLAGKVPPSAAPLSYGLLWADPACVDEGFEGTVSWPDEDVSRESSLFWASRNGCVRRYADTVALRYRSLHVEHAVMFCSRWPKLPPKIEVVLRKVFWDSVRVRITSGDG